MTRTSLIGRLLATLLACAAGPALADTTLRLSEPSGPGTPEAAALAVFKADVEARTGGRLRIDLHLRDGLAGPVQTAEGLRAGTIDLYTGPLDAFRHLAAPELGALSVPWLFESTEQLRRYLDGPVLQRAERALHDHGLRFVSTAFTGVSAPERVIVATRPLRTADDLAGLRIRVNADDLVDRAWRTLGAAPVALGWNETYLALRRRFADAAVVPLGEVRSSHFVSAAPFVAAAGLAPRVWPMVIGERSWKALDAGQRSALVAAADEAGRTYARLTAEAARRDLAALIEGDKVAFARIEVAPLRRRLEPLWQDLVTRGVLPREVMETVTARAP